MQELSNVNEWTFELESNPILPLSASGQLLVNSNLFKTIIECIQDGVSILDEQLYIKYVNTTMSHWYSKKAGGVIGNNCFSVFHDRKTPCPNCPVQKAIESKTPQVEIVKHDRSGEHVGMQILYAIPVMDNNNNIACIIEYIKDISYQYETQDTINKLSSTISKLQRKNKMLSKMILDGETMHHKSTMQLIENIQELIDTDESGEMENVTAASDRKWDLDQKNIRNNIIEIHDQLSKRENQVCRLIKDDFSSKEISNNLFITQKTVEFHRSNIRNKLKVDKSVSLHSYLKENY